MNRWLACLLLWGCGLPGPAIFSLSLAPIVDGTPELEAIARSEMLAFDERVGPGRVRLSELRFGGAKAGTSGTYFIGPQTIGVDPIESEGELRDVIRHELCHALDHQNLLVDGRNALWTAALAEFPAPLGGYYVDKVHLAPHELFAAVCQHGPLLSGALASPCPGDNPLALDIAAALIADAWGADVPDRVPMDPTNVAWQAPWPPDQVFAIAQDPGDGMLLSLIQGDLHAPDAVAQVQLDVADAQPVAGVVIDDEYEGVLRAQDTALPTWAEWSQGFADASADGVFLISTTNVGWLPPDVVAPRVLIHASDQWQIVDTCPGTASSVFHTTDAFWVLRADGDHLSWSPVEQDVDP